MEELAYSHWNDAFRYEMHYLKNVCDVQNIKWRRRARIEKMLAPWYWLKLRLRGTWRVWASGYCQTWGCDHHVNDNY